MDVDNGERAQAAPRGRGWLRTREILLETLQDHLTRGLPHRRVARLAGLLILSGEIPGGVVAERLVERLSRLRRDDGGWVDCEDTAWCVFVLHALHGLSRPEYDRTIAWLEAERAGDGWGYCRRDVPNIPLTATVRLLLPELRDQASALWLNKAWGKDIRARFKLSYKAAWFLLARGDGRGDEILAEPTVAHLIRDQRDDGSWGPWRDHAAPGDCFATGIAMWALARSRRGRLVDQALQKALSWCERNRLSNGFFPTHFIEEGSAWLYVGASFALKRNAASLCE